VNSHSSPDIAGPLVVSASGMAAWELARNEKYIFAYPPRYYCFDWYELLDEIIKTGAVQAMSGYGN